MHSNTAKVLLYILLILNFNNMAICTNSCNDVEMVAHDYNECLPTSNGNAYSVAYALCDGVYDQLKVDFTDEAIWNLILTGATPNEDLVIVDGVVVNLTSEVATGENPYKNGYENTKTGETFTFSMIDPNISNANFDFYKALDRKSAYLIIAFKDGRMWVAEEKMLLFSKTPAIEQGSTQSFTVESSRTFENGKGFLQFDTQPAGIFTY